MKKAGITLFTLMLALTALAQDTQIVTVKGDRVSLRAAPELNAVLLGRAMSGDQLLLADNSNPEWVGVRPPQKIDLWVHSRYLRDGVVLPARLNVRSGPGRSHSVVGIVLRGEKLTPRGELHGWVRIAPPEEAVVWISRRYTDFSTVEPMRVKPVKFTDAAEPVLITGTEAPVEEKKSKIIITVEPNEPALADVIEPSMVNHDEPELVETVATEEEVEQVVQTVLQPIINDLLIAAASVAALPDALMPDPEKKQGVDEQFSGTLQPANAILYKLVDPKFDTIVVCYIRGNSEQMAAYAGHQLTLSGKVYWAKGLNQPLLVPEKIEVLSEAPVE